MLQYFLGEEFGLYPAQFYLKLVYSARLVYCVTLIQRDRQYKSYTTIRLRSTSLITNTKSHINLKHWLHAKLENSTKYKKQGSLQFKELNRQKKVPKKKKTSVFHHVRGKQRANKIHRASQDEFFNTQGKKTLKLKNQKSLNINFHIN